MGNLGFVPSDTAPGDDFEPLPEGVYRSQIKSAEVKDNANQDGKNLELEFEVLDNPYKGRTIKQWLAIQNKGEDAERIARGKLSSLCRKIGLTGIPDDSAKLLAKKLMIGVKQKTYTKNGETRLSNEVKSYKEYIAIETHLPPVAPVELQGGMNEPGAIPFEDDSIPF